ncbi:histone-lysine N-methyltransferase, H3 lysine-9 specific SUVH5-like [Lolium rigidum]|uniref:histone-lysine N-methyltransferase, H3 lysine-9 specific SUVH5-like n=1 Tax=Lolium rigidum TaxID=89674 RepID=UPI001F5D0C48|nr:histone-lysine N-methyltransferase, H3 lysine-9 specific SUVH5-like [Lolium rigidum]
MPAGFTDRAACDGTRRATVAGITNGYDGAYAVSSRKPADDSAAVGGGATRKRRKAIVPWRFHIGYKRQPWTSQGNGSQSHGPPRTDGPSRQCAPEATAPNQKSVSVAIATRKRSTLKRVQTGTAAPVHCKKRVNKGPADSHQAMPKSKIAYISRKNALASLQEFRLIYRSFKFLFQDQPTYRPDDYEALWVFRDRYSVKRYDGRRYVGRVPGVEVGDVFDSDAELHLTGLHRSRDSHVDYIVSKEGDMMAYQAVSIVSSYGQHSHDENNNLDLLQHVGSVAITAGHQMGGIEQLALKQNMDTGTRENPVSAINLKSNEYPMSFLYISRIRYHDPNDRPDPPSGCDCIGGCSDSQECACAVKNGGEIPFNDDGLILEEKPLIYECGPSCKCPPTCHNRVSQHRIKFRLQVFKTELMGWGVRSLDFIPKGSFVCEYVGELLDNKDAQERANDEYLFITGDKYFDVPRWEGISETIVPSLRNRHGEDDAKVFSVDALTWSNLARFINHSCNPNLFTQNVLYDHDDVRMPHIMLFACGNIPPLQPLSFDYNYDKDGVHDSQGHIKKKQCLCGSRKCKGRLY